MLPTPTSRWLSISTGFTRSRRGPAHDAASGRRIPGTGARYRGRRAGVLLRGQIVPPEVPKRRASRRRITVPGNSRSKWSCFCGGVPGGTGGGCRTCRDAGSASRDRSRRAGTCRAGAPCAAFARPAIAAGRRGFRGAAAGAHRRRTDAQAGQVRQQAATADFDFRKFRASIDLRQGEKSITCRTIIARKLSTFHTGNQGNHMKSIKGAVLTSQWPWPWRRSGPRRRSPRQARARMRVRAGRRRPRAGSGRRRTRIRCATSRAVVFQVLLGEMALQRGNLDLAVSAYADLAYRSRDPKVLERATEVASIARRFDIAYETARLWVAVAPESAAAGRLSLPS